MFPLITQIATFISRKFIATTFVGGNLSADNELLTGMAEKFGQSLSLLIKTVLSGTYVSWSKPEGHELQEQSSGDSIDGSYHLQFARALHLTVAINVFFDVLHLLRGEERQLFQVLARGVIDVDLVVIKVLKKFVLLLAELVVNVFNVEPVLIHFLPGQGRIRLVLSVYKS